MIGPDFRSTDLEGAAYYAGIFGGLDPVDERVSRLEAEWEEALEVVETEQIEDTGRS